jgi:hypothetical protein
MGPFASTGRVRWTVTVTSERTEADAAGVVEETAKVPVEAADEVDVEL